MAMDQWNTTTETTPANTAKTTGNEHPKCRTGAAEPTGPKMETTAECPHKSKDSEPGLTMEAELDHNGFD